MIGLNGKACQKQFLKDITSEFAWQFISSYARQTFIFKVNKDENEAENITVTTYHQITILEEI